MFLPLLVPLSRRVVPLLQTGCWASSSTLSHATKLCLAPTFTHDIRASTDESMSTLGQRRFSTSCHASKFQDILSQQVNLYFKNQQRPEEIDKKIIEDSDSVEQYIPKYLVTIASDPFINSDNILTLFKIYASMGRPLMQDKIEYPEQFKALLPVTEQSLKEMSYTELKQLAGYLSLLRNQKLSMINTLINAISGECSSRLHKPGVSLNKGIEYFEIPLDIYGNGIASKSYYEDYQIFFCNHLDEASSDELLKIMHYSTVSQKTVHAPLVEKCLKLIEDKIETSSFNCCGIIANSVMRSNFKLTNKLSILPSLAKQLIENIRTSSKWSELDIISLTSITELLRLSRYFDAQIMLSIETFISKCDVSQLTNDMIPSLLAYMTNYRYNPEVFQKVENVLIENLKKESISLSNLARILWSFSTCDHRCSQKFVDIIFGELHSQIIAGKTDNNLFKFTDILLSLALMGHFDAKMCTTALKSEKERGYSGKLSLYAL